MRVLALARDALDFLFTTGQRYEFEDFFTGRDSRRSQPSSGGTAELRERMARTRRFFEPLRDEPESAEEAGQCQAILDALHYIDSTGQHEAFGAFLEHVEADAPPFVVASFDTREEAESWLVSHPRPPDPALVLIGDEYHQVVHERETNIRRLPRSTALEFYLAELEKEERPEAVTSFETREEADAWWSAQATPTRRAWVEVGGELYLAVSHPNISHHALYPLSRGYAH